MKEILKKCRRWFCLQKRWRRIVIISGAGLLLAFLLLCFWLKYWYVLAPFNLRTRLAIDKLALSCYNQPVCHEDCFLERERYRQIIVTAWREPRWQEDTVSRLINENENECLRLELAELWAEEYPVGSWPKKLNDYLTTADGGVLERMRLSKKLEYLDGGLEKELMAFIADQNNIISERYEALQLLSQNPNPSQIDFYFQLWQIDPSLKIKEQALIALSGMGGQSDVLAGDRLLKFLDFLHQPSADIYLKKTVVFLLSDYLTVENVRSGLTEIFSDKAVDKFTRTFLADILDIAEGLRPVVSAAEWQEYSENSIAAQSLE